MKRLWEKIRWECWCFYYCLHNFWVFRSAVWHFDTCSYDGLLDLMRVATREMRNLHRDHGVTVAAPKIARQLTVASELCRRLGEDNYFENAGYGDGSTWESLSHYRQTAIVAHARKMEKQDAELLGNLLKRVQWWWD